MLNGAVLCQTVPVLYLTSLYIAQLSLCYTRQYHAGPLLNQTVLCLCITLHCFTMPMHYLTKHR
jgi:hypothetical protein